MSKNSIKWGASFIFISFIFVFPESQHVLMGWTEVHPYIMGGLKFSVLAFLGELMSIRISNGEWKRPKGILLRIF
ncbi:MAG TPA: hypothetical protein PKC47_01065, partial [Petrimonas sp.]|nr:hypothetical protein [Petrimonas sp.]